MKTSLFSTLLFFLLSGALSAQCYPDRHNTTWHDGWVSCEPSLNPNEERGVTHWIQYDFGHLYILDDLKLWNFNDPTNLDLGVSQVTIDYSVDGVEWVEFGSFFFDQGPGISRYEGEEAIDMDDIQAEHVLITVDANHGGPCVGFAEVLFGINGVISSVDELVSANACFDVQVYPNPHREDFRARISSECGEPMRAQLIDAMGRVIYSQVIGRVDGEQVVDFTDLGLAPGLYYLSIEQGAAVGRYQIVRME